MKAESLIKYCALGYVFQDMGNTISNCLTEDEVEDLFDEYEDECYNAMYELREGEVMTNIEPPSSRHYESSSVAAKAPNGQWVGWTYWYGGGKHSCPEEIDWIERSYLLVCKEEVKVVTVLSFTKES